MRQLLIAGLLLLAFPAMAAETTLTWTNPTRYADGTPLLAADIVSHRVEWTGRCPDFGFVAASLVFPGSAQSAVIRDITPGYRCFRVFVSAKTTGCVVTETETCVREGPASNVWGRRFESEVASVMAKDPSAATDLAGT